MLADCGELDPCHASGIDERLGFLQGGVDRLLDEHMLSGIGSLNTQLGVQTTRGADDHCVTMVE
jgi:hypothetical protein